LGFILANRLVQTGNWFIQICSCASQLTHFSPTELVGCGIDIQQKNNNKKTLGITTTFMEEYQQQFSL